MGDLWAQVTGTVDPGPLAFLGIVSAYLYRLLARTDRISAGNLDELKAQRDQYQRRAEIAEAKARIYERQHGPLDMADVVAEVEARLAWERGWPHS